MLARGRFIRSVNFLIRRRLEKNRFLVPVLFLSRCGRTLLPAFCRRWVLLLFLAVLPFPRVRLPFIRVVVRPVFLITERQLLSSPLLGCRRFRRLTVPFNRLAVKLLRFLMLPLFLLAFWRRPVLRLSDSNLPEAWLSESSFPFFQSLRNPLGVRQTFYGYDGCNTRVTLA